MEKRGRNDPCHCGSGKKYKKCHLSSDSGKEKNKKTDAEMINEINKAIQGRNDQNKTREEKFGLGREAITVDHQGHKFVAVGSRLHFSKTWKTFPDFLMNYTPTVIGTDWGNAEIKKQLSERNMILQWYDGMCRWQRKGQVEKNGLFSGVPNGVTSAYLLLAYDLYTIEHNAKLQQEVVRRLKINDQFQGARYELTVAATMVRAGFEIQYEDETDRSRKHAEFIATHKQTKQQVAVEAKSRHRPGVLGHPGDQRDEVVKADVGRLLTQAVLKEPENPFMVFIDLNLPPLPRDWAETFQESKLGQELGKAIQRAGDHFKDGKDPFNAVAFTNFPHHYGGDDEPDPLKHHLEVFSQKPRYAMNDPNSLFTVTKALNQYGTIPNDFSEA